MTAFTTRGPTRTELLGYDTYWKVSELGVLHRRHDYPADLLARILTKALALKSTASERQHLDLRVIPGAGTLIPEINELVRWPGRLEALSELAGATLEPHPVSVLASFITFMGAAADDGVAGWHADGVPVTEIIPLRISEDAIGGDLRVYCGNHEHGRARQLRGEQLDANEVVHFPHRMGQSTLAQLMRVLHSTEPMSAGHRISLNLTLRSATRPYIDDNALYFLGADNPSFDWVDEYLDDVKNRQLPAYMATQTSP